MHTNHHADNAINVATLARFWAVDNAIYDGVTICDADLSALCSSHSSLRELVLAMPATDKNILEKIQILRTEVEREHDGCYFQTLGIIEADLRALS